jgi:hypothetical protein
MIGGAVVGIMLAIAAVAGMFVVLLRRNKNAQSGDGGDYQLCLANRDQLGPVEQVRS